MRLCKHLKFGACVCHERLCACVCRDIIGVQEQPCPDYTDRVGQTGDFVCS